MTSAKIFATKTAGTYFANIGEKTITFSNGDSSPQYQQFTVSNVPTSVKKGTVTWQWKFKPVGSEQNITSSGPHTIYVVLASPKSPELEPRKTILDYACNWASGQSSHSGVCTAILNNGFDAHYMWRWDCHWLSSDFVRLVASLGIGASMHCWSSTYHYVGNMTYQRTKWIDPVGPGDPNYNPPVPDKGEIEWAWHQWAQASGSQRDPSTATSKSGSWGVYEDYLFKEYETLTPSYQYEWVPNEPGQPEGSCEDWENDRCRYYSWPTTSWLLTPWCGTNCWRD